jgi:hypothetical protein
VVIFVPENVRTTVEN